MERVPHCKTKSVFSMLTRKIRLLRRISKAVEAVCKWNGMIFNIVEFRIFKNRRLKMRKKKDTHSFDFRPLGLAIREAREKAGLSRNDLGDKVFYGERHIADIENIGKHPSFQLFHDLVTMFNISVDEYFYPAKNVEKNTARRQIDSSLDLLSDNELKIIQGTIDGILNSRENKK